VHDHSVSKGQHAIREAFDGTTDRTGNLLEMPRIFPRPDGPIVRHGTAGRWLAMMRWRISYPPTAICAALEAVGLEFTNGGEPCVQLENQER
jgi:hypothetical protein